MRKSKDIGQKHLELLWHVYVTLNFLYKIFY